MSLLNLIKNENMKLYQQRTTYISFLIAYILTFSFVYIQTLQGKVVATSFWEFTAYVVQSANQAFFVLTVIIASQIINSEFSGGTIKLLLISSNSRANILLSKYLATLLFSLLGFLGSIILGCINAAILFGFKGITQLDVALSLSGPIMLKLLIFPFYTSVAFALAILTRNIGLSLLISLMISLFTSNYIPIIPGFSIPLSLGIWTTFYMIFTIIGWTQFKKQDI
ncbi:ABC transporter permease [Bacillus sp. C1]